MNCDTMLIYKVLGKINPFEAIILTCNVTPERSDDPVDQAVDSIKAYQIENKDKIVQGVQKETQKQIDNVEKKMRMETNGIKNLLKKEIEGDKDAMFNHMLSLKLMLRA